jgi:DNA-directed RNA polymerase specialized sigma24 family protein
VSAPSPPPNPPSRAAVDAALRAVAWPKVQKQVLAYAFALTKSKAHAEDLTQDAIRRAFDPEETPWNPVTVPNVAHFLMSLVRRNASNERSSGRRHHEITVRSKRHEIRVTRAANNVPSPGPTPESSLAVHDLAARRLAALRTRAADDKLVLALIDLIERDVETPAEQAEALSTSVQDITFARRRLFRHAEAVARDLPGEVAAAEATEVAE